MLGALIIQSLTTTILSAGVPPEVIRVVKAIVILIVVLLQSQRFRQLFRPLVTALFGSIRRDRETRPLASDEPASD
jgi:ABC-type uncharacterized transport system permease subunit